MSDLLPPNSTPQERALSEAIARIGDIPARVRDVWNPDTCPGELLPWLAWAFSVDNWDVTWNEAQKRDTVKKSLEVHKYKGTIGAVRDALGALGINVEVQEWFNQSPAGTPYTFNVYLESDQQPIGLNDVAKVLDVINSSKNLRSHLGEVVPMVRSQSTLYLGCAAVLGHEINLEYDSGTPPVGCTYAFNSDDAAAVSFGFDGAVDMTGPQAARHIVQGGGIAEDLFSTNSAFATVDYTVGTKAIEFLFGSSAASLVSSPAVASIGFSVIDPSVPEILAGVSYWVTPSGIEVNVSRAGSLVGTVTAGTSSTVGFEIDADAGAFIVTVDGTPVTLSNDSITPGNLVLAMRSGEQNVTNIADVGITLTAEVRIAALDITQTYSPGATDICDNAL